MQTYLENRLGDVIDSSSSLTRAFSTTGIHDVDRARHKELFQIIKNQFDKSMLRSKHEYRLDKVELCHFPNRINNFKGQRTLHRSNPNIRLVFHGTKEGLVPKIAREGFDDSKMGTATDPGYLGKGHYFSPHIFYSAAYCDKNVYTSRFRRLNYENPLDVGVSLPILCCFTVAGKTKQMYCTTMGSDLEDFQSRWAWVDKGAFPLAENDPDSRKFALEIAIGKGAAVLPRFILYVTRVDKVVIWRDPSIYNDENWEYVKELHKKYKDTSVVICDNGNALRMVQLNKEGKEGVKYKIMTSGREGENFVRNVRSYNKNTQILVFCMAVEYHKKWASKFRRVDVTSSKEKMISFCKV